jgi:hypothetical protein
MYTRTFCLILAFFLAFAETSQACNGGCPAGGGYMGIVPQFSKNLIGLRYRYRSFDMLGLEKGASTVPAQHVFQTTELWGRFYPHKRWQVFGFLPFQMNLEKQGQTVSYLQGVGDLSFIVNYNLVNTGDSLDRTFKHNLLLGVGAKLPTGKYQQRDAGKQMYPTTLQTGTGAYSAIFNAIYTVRHSKLGLNLDFQYRYNFSNELDYSFGDMAMGSGSLFYWLEIGSISVLPNLGTYFENAQRDIEYGYYLDNTGGTLGYAHLGVDVYAKQLILGVNAQVPYLQDTPLRSQQNDLRMMGSMGWLF